MRRTLLYSCILVFLSCGYRPNEPRLVRLFFFNGAERDGLLFDVTDSLLSIFPAEDEYNEPNTALRGEPMTYPLKKIEWVGIRQSSALPAIIGGLTGCLGGSTIGCIHAASMDSHSPFNTYSFIYGFTYGTLGLIGGAIACPAFVRASNEYTPHKPEDLKYLKSISVKGLGL